METPELGATLNTLMHLDRETAHLYSQAIPSIGESDVAEELKSYRREHAVHADECFEALRDIGAEVAQRPIAELTDFMAMEEDAVMNAAHLDTSLMALFIAEEAVTLHYAEALQQHVPPDVKDTLRRHLEDDRRHLTSVRDSLQAAADGGTSVRVGL
jgi:rubrerythrin